ncbi:MAG: thiamine-phosphate kinase [Candidatus Omnitrophota bacterium]
MRELEYIKYITRRFRVKKPVVKGIGDDCAIIDYTKDKYLLLTTDMIIEGTHFSNRAKPFQIGWKAMACSISDIASMGGAPRYAVVSAGIPRKKSGRYLKEVTKGIEKICKEFNVTVVGGDTNSSDKVVLSVTLIGEVDKKKVTRRSGAKPGDLIFVTGAIGEGKRKHLTFVPRAKEARVLVDNFKVRSMIDLSDGLAMDLNRLTKASRVGARVYKSLLPLSEHSEPLDRAICSGEDFELLFTISLKEARRMIMRMGRRDDLPITLIGEIVDRRFGVKLIEESGKAKTLKPKGFEHL